MKTLGDLRVLPLCLAFTTTLHIYYLSRIAQTTHYSRYSSVPADAGAIHPADARDARGAGLTQFAGATS